MPTPPPEPPPPDPFSDPARLIGGPEPPADPWEKRLPQVEGYEILRELGHNAAATRVVYLARHRTQGRVVALKVMPSRDPAQRRCDLAEAEALSHLQHPNFVAIHEVGESGGHFYLALEFIDGGSLDRLLQGRPQPARAAAGLVEVLARAIDYAHRRGVLHLDLKPANILLARDGGEGSEGDALPPRSPAEVLTRSPYGTPKIMDFGVAEPVAGAIRGTPCYMAPEQALGQPPTPAADVYGLGAILYEMLTGRPPFRGATVEDTLEQVRRREPVPPAQLQPRLPSDLNTICLQCLRKRPDQRYVSARELAEDLRRFLEGEPIRARPEGHVRCWLRRHKALAGALGLAAAALLTVSVAAVLLAVHSSRSAAELRRQQEQTSGALRDAREQHEAARERVRLAESRLAETYLDRGLAHCTQEGDPAAGLLWLARALESAPGEAADLHRVLRANLAAWHALPARGGGPVLRHPGEVCAVAFSPDGKAVLTGNTRGEALLWDVATGKPLGPGHHEFPGRNTGRSPDGRLILEISGRTARLRSAAHGKPAGPPLAHKDAILAVAFSPDGRSVLTGSLDGAAQLWDTATSRAVGPAWRHEAPIRAVAFRPDGRMAVTAGNDRTARLWEVVAPLEGEAERIRLWIEVHTGLELDEHGTVRALAPDIRQERRRRLEELGGPPLP